MCSASASALSTVSIHRAGIVEVPLSAPENPEAIAVTPQFLQRSITRVLRDGDDVVGYYALTSEPDGPHLDKLFVDPEWIGTGAGTGMGAGTLRP